MNNVSLSNIISMEGLRHFFRPEQEKTRIALALGKQVDDLRLENRIVVSQDSVNNQSLVTVSLKPNFLKWLLFGRIYYQAKFNNHGQLVSIVKLKIRGHF